jgi:hypothetical protein
LTEPIPAKGANQLHIRFIHKGSNNLGFSDLKEPVKIEKDEVLESKLTPTDELLHTHYHLWHLLFTDIQAMAKRGYLPAICRF